MVDEPEFPTKAETDDLMAYSKAMQWTDAAILQAERIAKADALMKAHPFPGTMAQSGRVVPNFQTEVHLFAVVADQLIEAVSWAKKRGVLGGADPTELLSFREPVSNVRNKREHEIEYLKGGGKDRTRWITENPGIRVDMSSVHNGEIGGVLSWQEVAAAAQRFRAQLIHTPIPYGKEPGSDRAWRPTYHELDQRPAHPRSVY